MLGSIYVTVAVAFTLTIGILNFLNFTIPAIFMITGMVAWAAAAHGFPFGIVGGYSWPLALFAGVLAAVIASLIVERFMFRYLRIRHGDATEHAIPLVSSLGFLIIFENLVLIAFGSEAQTFPEKFKSDIYIGDIIIGLPQVTSLAISLIVVAVLSWVLKTTSIGRALRAIAENPDTANLLGIEVQKIVPLVFLFSGLLCGVAGVLFIINYSDVSPYMGDQVGTKAIAAMVLGGLGSIWGAIAGGLFVGLLEALSIHFLGADTVDVVVWGALLIVIIIKPSGLFGASKIGKGKL
jgi:branched-chain amino acid transport system permease protein|tara:strand:- start:252 stop:1133 length:882 start_codon:yes stop_codon:yes gene_type:complete